MHVDYAMVCDVNFSFSNYNAMNQKSINRKVDYTVITGYLRDYSYNATLKSARSIRDNLVLNKLDLKPLNKMKKFN